MIEKNIMMSNLNVASNDIVENDTYLEAKFIICDFDPNGNDVALNRQTIGMWLDSLLDNPVVGKIGINDDGNSDFESHNMSVVHRVGEDGNIYKDVKFDTSAIGVFTDAAIERIGNKEFIVATAKIWKRFPEFCAVIKRRVAEGTLHTSWEISVKKSHIEIINGKKIKVIDDGLFLGHVLLNDRFPPAYKDSQLLEVASQYSDSDDINLFSAIQNDIANISLKEKEDLALNENEKVVSDTNDDFTHEPIVEPETNVENSALTEYDLRKAVRQAVADKLNKDKWEFYIIYLFPTNGEVWVQMWDAESELDIVTFTFTADNDVVTVSEPTNAKLSVSISQINTTYAEMQGKIDELNGALIKSSETISSLNSTVSDLSIYKEKFETSEQEKLEKELSEKRANLKAYAVRSGFVSESDIETSEDIKTMIYDLNESSIKAIIAERFMDSLNVASGNVEPNVEVATINTANATVKVNISDGETPKDYKSFIKNYINK